MTTNMLENIAICFFIQFYQMEMQYTVTPMWWQSTCQSQLFVINLLHCQEPILFMQENIPVMNLLPCKLLVGQV